MAETRRVQHAIDFDEIERQIRESALPGVRPPPSKDDPLSDLARIVGHPAPQAAAKDNAADDWRSPSKLDPRLEEAMRSLEGFLRQGAPLPPDSSANEAAPPDQGVAAPASVTEAPEPIAMSELRSSPPAEDWTLRGSVREGDGRSPPVDLDEVSGRITLAAVPVAAAAAPAASPAVRPITTPMASAAAARTSAAPQPQISEPATSTSPGAGPEVYGHPVEGEGPHTLAGAEEQPRIEPGVLRETPRRASRKGLFVSATLLGIAAVGVAGALTFRGAKVPLPGGEPPLIKAEAGPIKVGPSNPGGLDVPNQNKQVLQRSITPPGPARVVASEEQPVDVKAIAREPAKPRVILPPPAAGMVVASRDVTTDARPVDSTGTVVALASPLGEPRKVKTVTIRTSPGAPPTSVVPPTVVAAAPPAVPAAAAPVVPTSRSVRVNDDPSAAAAKPTPVEPPAKPVAAKPAPVEPPAKPVAAKPTATLPEKIDTPDAPPAPVEKPKPVTKLKAKPKPVAAKPEPAATPASPPDDPPAEAAEQQPTPANPFNIQPAQQPRRVATVERPAAPAAATPPRPASGGSVVQVASATSEEEARSTLASLRAKFPQLANANPAIQRAEVNGQTRWRIRASGLSPEAAKSLCSTIASKGGACFVAR